MKSWKMDAPKVIDLSGLPEVPARVDLYAQGADEAGAFERRQCAHYLGTKVTTKPVRNERAEIVAAETLVRTVSGEGATLDEAGKTLTLPPRAAWPDAPFSMVKAVAVLPDGTETVLFEKIPAV